MNQKEVAKILDEIGTMLEVRGENPFKCRAYHNAAKIISDLTQDLNGLIESGELGNIKGIGEALTGKITELIKTGKLKYYDDLRKLMPSGLDDLLKIQGMGPKTIKVLFEKLKIQTLEELKQAAENHKLEKLDGFGAKTEENILKGIVQLSKHADKHLYSIAKEAADSILDSIKSIKGVIRCEIAGSLRRKKEIIGDIDIVVCTKPGREAEVMKVFTSHTDVEQVLAHGETKSSVILKSGINCDLRVVAEAEFPFALAYFTGSKDHNVAMRSRAKDYGLSLNEYGFSEIGSTEKRGKAKRIVKCKSEEDIFKTLELNYVPPELRENMGETDPAINKHLPRLVEEKDITGTFHCHTTASDGTSTLEEMVRAAMDLGWQYLGIGDHSKVAVYARGLSEERVKQQWKEIDTLNRKHSGFRVFKGTEADILPDGSLDWSEKLLAGFDYVVASVHSKFKMTEAEGTRRIIKALKNKHVTMLGHPTGRLLLEREGYPVNMIEVIKAASDYGKIIEINANPARLDLDWRYCKFAKKQGVLISINPDAHNTDGLRDVQYGVNTARKGWLEKKDVLNCRGVKEIEKYLNIK
jgi:DNA polymerase (family 10)